MNHEQINKLTVNDVIEVLFFRLFKNQDLSTVPDKWFWYKDDIISYDNLELHPSFVKPTLEEFEAELVKYKQELIDIENERLRIEALMERWNTLARRDAGIPAFYRLVKFVANAQYYMLVMIKNKKQAVEAEALMTALELEDAKIVKENADRKKRDDLIAIGRKEKEQCENVNYLLAGYNTLRELTPQQSAKLKSDFKSVKDKLNESNPKEAKTALESLAVDGTIITNEIKEALLKELQ
jgi:hypothetical protein